MRFARRERGYTAIEVMIAMTILTIGAGAVISMQRGAVQGNVDARRIDTANSIARIWMERLRNESFLWTLPNSASPNTSSDNRTTNAKLLATVDGAWHAPMARVDDLVPRSPGFDILGRDVPRGSLGDGTPAFCTQVRLTWLTTNDLIRADVRVFWPRGLGVTMAVDCGTDVGAGTLDTNLDNKYRFVYATTSIRRNAQ